MAKRDCTILVWIMGQLQPKAHWAYAICWPVAIHIFLESLSFKKSCYVKKLLLFSLYVVKSYDLG